MINRKKLSIWEKTAVIITALACIISGFSFWTSFNTLKISESALQLEQDAYEIIRPFQKPIIYLSDSKVKSYIKNISIEDEIIEKQIHFSIKFNVSNAGRGIAENFNQFIFIANLKNHTVRYRGKLSIADKIYPDNPFTMRIEFSYQGGNAEEIANGSELGFIIRSEFTNFIDHKKLNETHWGKLHVNFNHIIKMTSEEAELLLENYKDEVKKITELT